MKTCSFCNCLPNWRKQKTRELGFKLNYCPECGRRLLSVASFTDERTGIIYKVGISKAQLQVLAKDWDNTSGETL